MSTPGERMAAEMAEQEAQEWCKGVRYRDGWYELEAGEHVTDPMPEWLVDRILADHKAQQEVRELRAGLITQSHIIEQVLGQALGYPWYKDDPKNFPDATEADGVCVGDHVAESLADQAARIIRELREELAREKGFFELTSISLRAQLQAAEAERDKLKGEALDCWFHHERITAEHLRVALESIKTRATRTMDSKGELDSWFPQNAYAVADDALRAEPTAPNALTTTTTLLQQAREALVEIAEGRFSRSGGARFSALPVIAAIDAHEEKA